MVMDWKTQAKIKYVVVGPSQNACLGLRSGHVLCWISSFYIIFLGFVLSFLLRAWCVCAVITVFLILIFVGSMVSMTWFGWFSIVFVSAVISMHGFVSIEGATLCPIPTPPAPRALLSRFKHMPLHRWAPNHSAVTGCADTAAHRTEWHQCNHLC